MAVFEIQIGGKTYEVDAPDQSSALQAVRGMTATQGSAALAVGGQWSDPETGSAYRVIDGESFRRPGEMTLADIAARQKVIAGTRPQAPVDVGQNVPSVIGPSDPAALKQAANDPAFAARAVAGTPAASRDLAIQMLGGQRAEGRGAPQTFAREAANTALMGLPRLASAAMSGAPTGVEHEVQKAADAAGSKANPNAAMAGKLLGIGAQAAALPTAVAATPMRGALTGALLSGGPAAIDTRGDIGKTAAAAATGAAAGAIGGAMFGGASRASIRRDVIANAPSREALDAAKDKAYSAVDQLDVQYAQSPFAEAMKRVSEKARKEGIDPTLHPKATAAMRRLEDATGSAPTLSEVETLRRIVRDASKTPDEGRIAMGMRKSLDDFVENATPAEAVRGDPTQAGALLREARGNAAAGKRSDVIQEALRRAEDQAGAAHSGGNINNATRQQFKSLLNSRDALRGFSDEEVAAIREVVRGTPTQNALRMVGKLMPASGLGGALVGGGAVTALGPAGLAIPATGMFAKALADRGTRKGVEYVDALIRSRSPAQKTISEAMQEAAPFAVTQEISPAQRMLMRALAAQARSTFAPVQP